MLEDRILEISRFITIDERNSSAWGEEIADFIVLTGNAMDTFFKDMYDCPNFGIESFKIPKDKLKLPEYQRVYEKYYELSENTVNVPHGLGNAQILKPFNNFNKEQPEWWKAYNETKHNFYTSMEKANLGNALNLLAGLLVLNALHFCSKYYLSLLQVIDKKYPWTQVLEELTKSKIGTTIWGPL